MSRVIASIFLAGAVCAALAQTDKPLTIGDPAPAFRVDGWAKGDPITALKHGDIYVVEFWATWCGPCIQSMPHLSDMADKYKGKATFISINTWDYRGSDGKPEAAAKHTERVNKFVKENDSKMRYNVAFDDSNDTMSATWMRAAGQNGIPCAIIVDGNGVVTWIGHPMEMESVLEKVIAKSWDMAAFKSKFEVHATKAREAAALNAQVKEIAKKGDMNAFAELMKKMEPTAAISSAITPSPAFGMNVIEKYAGKIESVTPGVWCSMSAYIAANKDATADIKARAVKVSEMCAGKTPEKEAALAYAYLARCQFAAGKKAKGNQALDKAMTLVAKYEPAQHRDSIKKFIENTRKEFAGG